MTKPAKTVYLHEQMHRKEVAVAKCQLKLSNLTWELGGLVRAIAVAKRISKETK